MTVEEVDCLAVACDKVSRRYGDYVRLAAFLGLRAGELTWDRACPDDQRSEAF